MAQKIWRCRGASKVDIFNQQVGGDYRLFAGAAAKDGGVVTDACDQRFVLERRRRYALPQRLDEIKFAF